MALRMGLAKSLPMQVRTMGAQMAVTPMRVRAMGAQMAVTPMQGMKHH